MNRQIHKLKRDIAIAKKSKKTWFPITDMELEKMPEEFFDWDTLESLTIKRCSGKMKNVERLKGFKKLFIEDSDPNTGINYFQIESLRINSFILTELTEDIKNLTNLKIIWITR